MIVNIGIIILTLKYYIIYVYIFIILYMTNFIQIIY